VEARQEKVAGEYVKAVQAMDQKYLGTAQGVVGPTEQPLADQSHGGVVGLVFGAFGECSQSVDLLVELRQAHRGARLRRDGVPHP